MKAKELAEQLLKYPDFDVEVGVLITDPVFEYPWGQYQLYKIRGIDGVMNIGKIVVLKVEEAASA